MSGAGAAGGPPDTLLPKAQLQGIGWMIVAAFAYSASAAMVRHLDGELNAFELVFLRTLIGVATLLPWLEFKIGMDRLKTPRLPLYLLRGIFTYVAMVATFFALGHMPVADVFSLQFTLPLFSILFAVLFLREGAGSDTCLACLAGFAGTLVILRPGFVEISVASLASAALYGGANVCIKSLSGTEPVVLITFYGNVIVLPLAFIPTLFMWTTPSLEQMGWITALGVTNTLGQIVLARAITAADARIVWPFDFLRLPFAVLPGYFMLAELPGQ